MGSSSQSRTAAVTTWWSARSRIRNIATSPMTGWRGCSRPGGRWPTSRACGAIAGWIPRSTAGLCRWSAAVRRRKWGRPRRTQARPRSSRAKLSPKWNNIAFEMEGFAARTRTGGGSAGGIMPEAVAGKRVLETAPHDRGRTAERRSILTRKRFQFAGALLLGAILPWALRVFLPGKLIEASSLNALTGNVIAIAIAFWMRLSVEIYPGIRRSYVIFPAALTGHGLVLVWFVLSRFPYDRLGLALGFALHVCWLYTLYVFAERRVRRHIAVVPFGDVERLIAIKQVDWLPLSRPRLHDARACSAIVADFAAELPDEWEGFLADAAVEDASFIR